jgi:hypothetical protein
MCTDVEADFLGRNRMRLILGERRKKEKIRVGGVLGKFNYLLHGAESFLRS